MSVAIFASAAGLLALPFLGQPPVVPIELAVIPCQEAPFPLIKTPIEMKAVAHSMRLASEQCSRPFTKCRAYVDSGESGHVFVSISWATQDITARRCLYGGSGLNEYDSKGNFLGTIPSL
jgi:hypothetical protein